MNITYGPRSPMEGDIAALRDHVRSGEWIAAQIGADPRFKGRVLDAGCGSGPSIPHYYGLYTMPAQLDGLDPFPEVWTNPTLVRRWQGEFDKCPVPENEYDAVLSMNVVEHVDDPAVFAAAAFRVLKPGGRLWALTPSSVHPFPWCVRLIQAFNLKQKWVEGKTGMNHYPAYYRLNSPGAVIKYGSRAGFDAATIIRHPNLQWENYFPAPLRFIPRAYDLLLGTRFVPLYQQFVFCLQKPGQWTGPSPRMSESELADWRERNPAPAAVPPEPAMAH